MGTYSDPALILPGSVGQTEVDATLKREAANGVAGLDASAEGIAPPAFMGQLNIIRPLLLNCFHCISMRKTGQ